MTTARRKRRFRQLLDAEHGDPLSGVANLFDTALAFVVALLIAFVSTSSSLEGVRSTARQNPSEASQAPRDGEPLERYRLGDRQLGGDGQRLGIAYRLPSGEVIYVPERSE